MRKINKMENRKIIEKKTEKVRAVFSFFFWKDKIKKTNKQTKIKLTNF